MLLSEVALGDMYEVERAEYMDVAKKGYHSTKGCGKTEPSSSVTINGVVVPNGVAGETKRKNSSLLYNEYIVYDVGQVNIKYMLQMKFVYGR